MDEVLLRNYFTGVTRGTFLECGAGDGVTHSCCLYFEESGWRGINLEPCRGAFEQLTRNRPHAVNLNVGLGCVPGVHSCLEIVDAADGVLGIMMKEEPHLDELRKAGYRTRPSSIEVVTYSSLNAGALDLFVLDVEGHELQAIDGMTPPWPAVMCVEYPFVGLEVLKSCLTARGYRFDFISYNNAFFSRTEQFVPGWGQTDIWEKLNERS